MIKAGWQHFSIIAHAYNAHFFIQILSAHQEPRSATRSTKTVSMHLIYTDLFLVA